MQGLFQKVWSYATFGFFDENERKGTFDSFGKTSLPIRDARYTLFNVKKKVPKHILDKILEKSWDISPLDTLKIIFYLRDCRGGRGYRDVFYHAMEYLGKTGRSDVVEANLGLIPYFGYFGDLLVFFGTPVEQKMIEVYTNQLENDLKSLKAGKIEEITLAAKYAPSEKGFYDKNFDAVKKFAKFLGVNKAMYRKTYLAPLREALDSRGSSNTTIVERKMSSNSWDDISFDKIPSIALERYNKAWKRHCDDYDDFEREKRLKSLYLSPLLNPNFKRKISSARTVEDVIGKFGPYCLIKLYEGWEPILTV